MSALKWDQDGERLYETGIDQVVLYLKDSNGDYKNGVAWNGVSQIQESPSGADPTDIYADNIKYLSIRAAEKFGATIECYTYPDEWEQCDGSAEPETGIMIGQQTRKPFGLSYRTIIGNDIDMNDHGYKYHLIYNATASPSERSYSTVNDSPEAASFSYEIETTPVPVTNYKPTSRLIIDSTKVDSTKLTSFLETLHGRDADAEHSIEAKIAELPAPDDVIAHFATQQSNQTVLDGDATPAG